MALDISASIATFKAFTDFTQQRVEAGKGKAVARATDTGAQGLAARAIAPAMGDKVAPWHKRSVENKDANNVVRALFRQSIIDMFGVEDRIPDSVKEAMLLKDYGRPDRPSGKPLNPHAKYGQALGEEFAFKTGDFNPKVKCTSSWKITVA